VAERNAQIRMPLGHAAGDKRRGAQADVAGEARRLL
jgi:hypothetical protein